MPKVEAVDQDACRYAGLHLKRMTYETRLLRLAAEVEALGKLALLSGS